MKSSISIDSYPQRIVDAMKKIYMFLFLFISDSHELTSTYNDDTKSRRRKKTAERRKSYYLF